MWYAGLWHEKKGLVCGHGDTTKRVAKTTKKSSELIGPRTNREENPARAGKFTQLQQKRDPKKKAEKTTSWAAVDYKKRWGKLGKKKKPQT